MNWVVYIVLCSDDTLYTGITNDLAQRLKKHAGNRGAKYFRGRPPKKLVYVEAGHSRSSAARRECSIKKMARSDKLMLLASDLNDVAGYIDQG